MASTVAYAKIQMTVEVETAEVYGADWTLGAVQEQVASEAHQKLANGLPKGVRIVGVPTLVDVVIRRTT